MVGAKLQVMEQLVAVALKVDVTPRQFYFDTPLK